ncbi:MAG: hypothetical protein J7621_01515 [Niastella sp.]|nr:hypothetical protein [Niastella sp.]
MPEYFQKEIDISAHGQHLKQLLFKMLMAKIATDNCANTYYSTILPFTSHTTVGLNTPIDNSNTLLIKMENAWKKQYEERREEFQLNDYELTEKMRLSTDILLQCSPDKMSLEVTTDKSIFYTTIKNDITIYVEHYIEVRDFVDDLDELIVTVFRGNERVFNYGGNFWDTVNKLQPVLQDYSIAIPQFA